MCILLLDKLTFSILNLFMEFKGHILNHMYTLVWCLLFFSVHQEYVTWTRMLLCTSYYPTVVMFTCTNSVSLTVCCSNKHYKICRFAPYTQEDDPSKLSCSILSDC